MSIAEKLTAIAENEQKVFDAGKKADFKKHVERHQIQQNYVFAFAGIGWSNSSQSQKKYYTYLPDETDVFVITTTASSMYAYSAVEDTIATIDITGMTNNVSSMFNYANNMVTIRKLVVSESTPAIGFTNCSKLVNITFEGTIGKSGMDMHWSTKLSKASIESVINALSDETTGLTVTLSQTAVDNAFATSEGTADGSTSEAWQTLLATKPNWTVALS